MGLDRVARVLDVVDELAEAAVELLCELIRIPSVNGSLAPDESPAGEARVAARLERVAREAGLRADRWEPQPGRANVVAWSPRAADGPSLLVGGHIDTVPAGDHALWGHGGPYSGERSDGRVWGLGACDMKAGVAAAFMAAIALERAGIDLGGRLLAHGVIGEESGEYREGSLSILDRGHRVDAVVIGEPTSGKGPLAIATASVGWLFLRLEVPGRPTHVALRGHVRRRGPAGVEDGVNAIETGIRLVARLADLERRWETTKRHPLFAPGDFCIHPGVFVARPGGIDNPATFAERATLMFSVLHPPQESSSVIRAEVEAEIAAACAEDPWLRDHRPRIDWPLDWPPVDIPPDSPLVAELRAAAAEVRGRRGSPLEAPVVAMQGVTDASWFAQRGIPAVVCGPGAAIDAHSAVESVAVGEYLYAIRLYALLALRWCAQR